MVSERASRSVSGERLSPMETLIRGPCWEEVPWDSPELTQMTAPSTPVVLGRRLAIAARSNE